MQQILVRRPGSYDRLEFVEAPTPSPGPGEVLVETAGIGVNFADVVVRIGLYPSAKEYVGWPISPGFEFSGRVVRVGEGVTDLAPGDPVYGVSRFGAYSTHVAVPRHYLFSVPSTVPLAHAGAVPVPFLTAYYALIVQGGAQAGKKVLIHSAAGGVGSAMVQIARALGCFVVGVVGSSHKVEAVRALGADVVIDKSKENLFHVARSHVPDGFDLVLDANGYETLRGSYKSLRPTGRLVIYGAHSMLSRGSGRPNWLKLAWTFLRTPRFHPLDLTNDNKSVLAFNLSYLFDEVEMLGSAMGRINGWFESGAFQLPNITEFPLRETARAHALLQSGTTVGKVLLVP